MSEENKIAPPEEYTALKMAKDVIDRLLKVIFVLIAVNLIIVTGFLVYNHFTVSQITTLTAEPDATNIITGNESPVTTYPNTNSNKNVSTNK